MLHFPELIQDLRDNFLKILLSGTSVSLGLVAGDLFVPLIFPVSSYTFLNS